MGRVTVIKLDEESSTPFGLAHFESLIVKQLSSQPFLMLHNYLQLPTSFFSLTKSQLQQQIAKTVGATKLEDLAVPRTVVSFFDAGDDFYPEWIEIETEVKFDGKPSSQAANLLEWNLKGLSTSSIQNLVSKLTPWESYIERAELYLAKELVRRTILPTRQHGQLCFQGQISCLLVAYFSSIPPPTLRKHHDFILVTEGSFKKKRTFVDRKSWILAQEFRKRTSNPRKKVITLGEPHNKLKQKYRRTKKKLGD